MRAPVDHIPAPPFPVGLPWANVAMLRMDKQRGRPVLVEFFDFCRVESLRTLPYLRAWHERYQADGLRVLQIHTGGFPPSRDTEAVREAVARLGIAHPVAIDHEARMWALYGVPGWPSRYLFGPDQMLVEVHHGEGGYRETEAAIQELLGVEAAPVPFVRPEDDDDAPFVVPTREQPGAYSGPYAAGAVWAVLEGHGEARANGVAVAVDHPGCYELVAHDVHTEGVLDLDLDDGVTCHAVCFTPGPPA